MSVDEARQVFGRPDGEFVRNANETELSYLPTPDRNGNDQGDGFEIVFVDGRSTKLNPILVGTR
jgi:hypothetical protein